MGKVFRAKEPQPEEREVALKVLKGELGSDPTYRRRFEREAAAAAKIHSSHVVSTYGHGEEEGWLFLVQQFVEGDPLSVVIEANPDGLPTEQAIEICMETAAGLDAIHAADIIHRDLKPQNILIDAGGEALVADLGLVKDASARTVLTQMGQTLGSISYMSPEQIRDPSNVDRRADVYALGCVAYECLCGSPPFVGPGSMQIMWGHMREAVPDPCERRPGLPEQVGWVLGKALEKDPAERPPTATAFARMLKIAANETS